MEAEFVCPATREQALAQLAEFIPRAGVAYARSRNYDEAPDGHPNVSRLSGALRHRVILEREVLAAIVQVHGVDAGGKFIDEVFWRFYFKGRLTHEPWIWRAAQSAVDAYCDELGPEAELGRRWRAACTGHTGIDCFDAWVNELVTTGYLHNHARMWFASIWIFTLKLPWTLGADFFMRHLLDGDAASNTLSWRWVAGLHTKGKAYIARAENIARFTRGRFNPVGKLDEWAEAISEPEALATNGHDDDSAMSTQSVPSHARLGVLLTPADTYAESWPLPADLCVASVARFSDLRLRTRLPRLVADESIAGIGKPLQRYHKQVMADAETRAAAHYNSSAVARANDLDSGSAFGIQQWIAAHKINVIATASAAFGPDLDLLKSIRAECLRARVLLIEIVRPEDKDVLPHTQSGYFRTRKMIPALLKSWGLT